MKTIASFQGEYRFLSNFWPAVVELNGELYPTVEHAYVAGKTLDLVIRKEIQKCETPGQVKRMGRSLILRSDWESIKLDLMYYLLQQKFNKDPLKTMLLNTGTANLIEGNTWGDTFWGVCNGKGQNHLGNLLMKVRLEVF